MNLEGILSISGKPGLYKQISQSKSGVIVETIPPGKRFLSHFNNRISALNEICIYTITSEKPLKDVFELLQKKEIKVESIKEDESSLRAIILDILPDYDVDRVYYSDLKKLFKWYDILSNNGFFKKIKKKSKSTKKVKDA